MTASSTSETSRKHVKDLIAKGKELYGVFAQIDPLSAGDPATGRIRAALAGIVDVLDVLDQHLVEDVRATTAALLAQDDHDAAVVFEGWLKVLRAARPYHHMIAALCADYPQWIEGLPAESLAACIKTMTGLCSCYGNDARGLVHMLCGHLKELAAPLQVQYIEMVETYGGHLEARPLGSLMDVLPLLYTCNDDDLVKQFKQAFTVDILAERSEAVKCTRAIAALRQSLPPEALANAIPLVVAVSTKSHGSATQVAAGLPRQLEQLGEVHRLRYVAMFKRVVEHAGICTVGFCQRELPQLVVEAAPEKLEHWVDCIRQVALDYGARAAMAFVDQETAASRATRQGLTAAQ